MNLMLCKIKNILFHNISRVQYIIANRIDLKEDVAAAGDHQTENLETESSFQFEHSDEPL